MFQQMQQVFGGGGAAQAAAAAPAADGLTSLERENLKKARELEKKKRELREEKAKDDRFMFYLSDGKGTNIKPVPF